LFGSEAFVCVANGCVMGPVRRIAVGRGDGCDGNGPCSRRLIFAS